MSKRKPANPPKSVTPSGVVPGTDAWDAAQELVSGFQDSIDRIRKGRSDTGYKLVDLWNDWYNHLMVICFGLGGALIALFPTVKFTTATNRTIFIAGAVLLILDGLYILLLRKHRLESESRRAITMGYELEYYSLVAKNRVLDVLNGKQFNQDEYEGAKGKLLQTALTELDQSYDETRKTEEHTDVAIVIFLAGLFLLGICSIGSNNWLIAASIIGLLLLVLFLIYLRKTAIKSKEEIKKRDEWLGKIKPERTRSSGN